MSKENGDNLVGMKDICIFLGVSEVTALKWWREYDLPIKKRGGIWVCSRKKIEEWNKKYLEENK